MYSFLYQPCIVEPTRIVSRNKPALLDNIFINVIEKDIKSGNFISKISDHLPNFLIINDLISKVPIIKRQVRNFEHFDLNLFNDDVSRIQILSILSTDVNNIYNDFQDKYLELIDKHAPMKTLSNREMRWKQQPWITRQIQNKMRIRDVLHKKYLRSKSTFWFNRFKLFRNSIKKMIFISKKEYYGAYFSKHESNSKKIWEGIGKIIHKNSKGSLDDIFINEKGNIITDQKQVANKFNNFYTSVAENLLTKLGNCNNKYQDYLKIQMYTVFLSMKLSLMKFCKF